MGRQEGEEHRDVKVKFQMRAKLMSIGDDSWIEDEAGNKVFKVNGKAMRVRDTWVVENAEGREVAKIREKKLSFRKAIAIDVNNTEAKVKKAFWGFRDRFIVKIDGAQNLKVKGKIADHEYKIDRDGDKIAEISKKWFRMRDTYGVEVEHPRDVPMVLAVTVAVDALSHPKN